MIRPRIFPPAIEPLESRIAPAAVLTHPLADISSGSVVDLSHLLDPGPARTHVSFTTNFDTDTMMAGVQPGKIVIELFDDLAPLTVKNFLSYVNTLDTRADYDGTFFHRIFDFGVGSQAGIDIIQGGGFETSSIRTHIPTGPTLVNEFRADLPDVRGTIAMAKVGGDPDSATSEWFFNVTDNSTILGAGNNGGFAVFGQVTAGLDVLDKIALAAKIDLGGALSDLPVQNLAAGATPNPKNLISLTDVRVEPGGKGDVTGILFETVSVTDAVTHLPTDLLSATVMGSDLNLAYADGKSGVATVKVRATQNGMSVEDEFNVTVKPNLHANVSNDGLTNLVQPGSSGEVSVKIANNGLATADTHVDVKIYLSKITPTDPDGIILDASDLLISEDLHDFTNQPINLKTGESIVLSHTITFAKQQLIAGRISDDYTLIAQVTPSVGNTLDQLFTDDDNAIDGSPHKAANVFGTFTDRDSVLHKNTVLTYAEADGDVVSVNFKGAGFGELIVTDDGVDLRASGTTASTVLTAKIKTGAHIALHDLQVVSQIGSVALGQADFSGSVVFSGGAKSIVLGDVNSDSNLIIGGFAPANTQTVAIKLGNVQDLRLESLMPVSTLTAIKWLDTTGDHDAISAVSIGALKITGGNLEANVFTSGSAALGTFAVSGLVRNSTIQINGALGKFTAGGLDGSSLTALGGAKSITTRDVADSSLTLGIAGISTGAKATLRFGRVHDSSITAFTPLTALAAIDWLDTDGTNDAISAPALGSLSITGRGGAAGAGDFEADLTLTGTAVLSKFAVAGIVKNAAIHTTGDVRSVNVGGFDDSDFFVGTQTFPNTLDSLGDRAIGSLIVRGAFSDSQVAAARFGTVQLQSAIAPTGGFVADAIKSYNRAGIALRNLDAPGDFDSIPGYKVAVL